MNNFYKFKTIPRAGDIVVYDDNDYPEDFTRGKKYIVDHVSDESIYVTKCNNGSMMGCYAYRWKPAKFVDDCKYMCPNCEGKCSLWESE